MRQRARVVIVGGGFGGLTVARKLMGFGCRNRCILTVIDKHPRHVFTPWLHKIAGGISGTRIIDDAEVALEGRSSLRFLEREVTGIDRTRRQIVCDDGSAVAFDLAIIAPGSVPNDMDIPGVRVFGNGIRCVEDAVHIRAQVADVVARAAKGSPETIVVVGGGPNGVELAAEMMMTLRRAQKSVGVEPGAVRLMMICAEAEILAHFPRRARGYARRRLERLGVSVVCNTVLSKVTDGMVHVRDIHDGVPAKRGRNIACSLCITALGVRPVALAEGSGAPVDQHGFVVTDATLRDPGDSGIFFVGDIAAPPVSGHLPRTAFLAIHEARYVARSIVSLLRHRPVFPYRPPRCIPTIVTLGGRQAVAVICGVVVMGYTAGVLRVMSDARYFFHTVSWFETMKRMIRNIGGYGQKAETT